MLETLRASNKMTLTQYDVITIFIATIIGLLKYPNKPAQVFGVGLSLFYILGIVTTEDILDNFSNPGLLTLMLLISTSYAIEKTGFIRLIARKMIAASYTATWLRLFGFTALCSSMLNNTAIVATLLSPIRSNSSHPASTLLIPLSFAAILGGTLTLIGTSTHLIVNSMYLSVTQEEIGFFDFLPIGLAATLSCGLALFWVSKRLPKHKTKKSEQTKSYVLDAKVIEGSPLIGRTVHENGLRHLRSLFLAEIVRDSDSIRPVKPSDRIRENDRLLFVGDISTVNQLQQFKGLKFFSKENGLNYKHLTEVIVLPDSSVIDKTLREIGFRAKFDAAVVAMKRHGDVLSGKQGDIPLKAGDFLVLSTGKNFVDVQNLENEFVIVSGHRPESSIVGIREWFVVLGFIVTILMSAMNMITLFKSMLIYLALLLITGVIHIKDMRNRLPLSIWFIVASSLCVASAMNNAGLIQLLSECIENSFDIKSATYLLIVIYLLTWGLTELVTNNAAAAIIFPIAVSVADGLNMSLYPFVMAIAFGASASFISPYGYQTNLMVYSSGGYHIREFMVAGLPIALIYHISVLTTLLYIYPLR